MANSIAHKLHQWKLLHIPLAFWVALLIPMMILVLGFIWFFSNGIIWQDLLTFAIFYNISLFGISIGAHRFLSHRSFKAPPWIESILFIMASSALQYSPLYWAGKHRKHHRFTDKPGDPHSPWVAEKPFKNRVHGWLHAHFVWAFDFDFEKNMHEFVPDLLRKPHLLFLHRHHFKVGFSIFILAGIFEFILIGGWEGFFRGIFWGSLFRLFLLDNSIFLINSLAGHGYGSRIFNLKDKSTNNILIFPLVLGDCWHHNHHACPSSATLQVRWYHLDPYFYILKLGQNAGFISNLTPFRTEHLEITAYND